MFGLVTAFCYLVVECVFPFFLELALAIIPVSRRKESEKIENRILTYIGAFFVGGILGYISGIIVPPLLSSKPMFLICSLVVGPFVVSLLMRKISHRRSVQEKRPFRFEGFWLYYCFALAFLTLRTVAHLGLY